MAHRAHSSFVIDRKDAAPAEWAGGQMSINSFYKTFIGDFAGTSVVRAVMLMTDAGGPAVYTGIERFDGALMGRRGTFLLTHAAVMHDGVQHGEWTIVNGSGTDELTDIYGTGEIAPTHAFTLDYDFNPE
jgi:hypothetical protein